MNISKDKLQKALTLYLNDVEDYDSVENYELAESIFSPFKNIITENDKITDQSIKEIYENISDNDKPIIDDFLKYINQIKK